MLYNWSIKKWVLLNPHLNLFEDDDYWYHRCDYLEIPLAQDSSLVKNIHT